MSSGYFPLSRRHDDWGTDLMGSISNLKTLQRRILDAAEDLAVAEDALSDGMYLGRMELAISLLEGLLEGELSDATT